LESQATESTMSAYGHAGEGVRLLGMISKGKTDEHILRSVVRKLSTIGIGESKKQNMIARELQRRSERLAEIRAYITRRQDLDEAILEVARTTS